MAVGERILSWFSRAPRSGDYHQTTCHGQPGQELALLRSEYANLPTLLKSKRVVDFGCGEGLQGIALAKEEGCFVVGLETNPSTLERAGEMASVPGIGPDRIRFLDAQTKDMLGSFDVVISQNAMKHVPDPESSVKVMKSLLNRGGKRS